MKKVQAHFVKKVQTHLEAARVVPLEKQADYLAELCSREPFLGRTVKSLLEKEIHRKERDTTRVQDTLSNAPQEYRSGDEIGALRILEKIGAGGMGVIYKAQDIRLQRHVAIKLLPTHLNTDSHIRQRFMAEARAASRLDHPNICVIYDVGETPQGQPFITMPYYEGETLNKRISRGSLPLREAVDIAVQIAEGLRCAHEHQIVHRDIKPSNIMLTRDRGVKVLDFGVAKVADLDLTSTGVNIGTLSYMSPEQLRGKPVDVRADVWALGLVLYECLTGKKAFPGKSMGDIIQSMLIENHNPLDSLTGKLPEPLFQVLRRALVRHPQNRFADMTTMLRSLYAARDALADENHSDLSSSTVHISPTPHSQAYQWDEQVLQRVVTILFPILGPITPVLVRRRAKTAADLNELRLILADSLPDQSSREGFFKQMDTQVAASTSPPVSHAPTTGGSTTGVELSSAQFAVIEASLITHLGPITQTMIKRHAMNASSMRELGETLARHLSSHDEKQRFQLKMHALLESDQ